MATTGTIRLASPTRRALAFGALACALTLAGASVPAHPAGSLIRLGVNPGPTGEIGDFVAKVAKAKGLEVKVTEFSDWVTINAAVDSGDIDVNLFQHKPFLAAAVKARGFRLVPVGPVAVMPVGLFSRRYKTAAQVPDAATVAIANDPVNAARGLRLFEKFGLIKVKRDAGDETTIADITDNPKHLNFVELEAAQLPRALDDVAVAQESFTYLLASGGDPKSALVTDGEGDRHYALEYVVRVDRKADPVIRRFVELAHSPEVRAFIISHFKGVLVPAW